MSLPHCRDPRETELALSGAVHDLTLYLILLNSYYYLVSNCITYYMGYLYSYFKLSILSSDIFLLPGSQGPVASGTFAMPGPWTSFVAPH